MTRLVCSLAGAASLLACVAASAATVTGTARVDGSPAVDAVVYLESAASPPVAPPPPASAPRRAVMDQKNLTFLPAVLPIARGTVVEFTNSDDVQHNVFSPSAVGGKFNLGTYGPGAGRSVAFDRPGDVVVLCNIHMEMEAHIVVLADRHFSASGSDGRYAIEDVPAGRYTLKIWKGRWLEPGDPIDVPPAGSIEVDVSR